ncbi:hypothetical protein MRX96_057525 [Rhipicephalus microplus]
MKAVDALENTPYLLEIEWFFHDFNLLVKKDGLKAIDEAFERMLSLILNGTMVARRKGLKQVLQVEFSYISARRQKHIQAVRVCGLLGKVLKQPDAVTQLFVPLVIAIFRFCSGY